jgi:superfamily II DNA or RNA helicase
MSDTIQELFEAVRSACSAGAWSRGVELVRAEAVTGEADDDGEISLRVSTRGGLICPSVILMPEDAEWECDCASREEGCEHAAAAVIALRRARREGRSLPGSARSPGRIGYRMARTSAGLRFERVVVTGDGEEPLRSTLTAITSGRVDGPRFAASRADIEVERTLGTRLRGELPRGVWPALLAALADCPDVQLDGRPIRASAEGLGFVAVLDDAGEDFRLRVSRDPRIEEIFQEGVARAGDALCPLLESRLTGRELEELSRGRHFEAGAVTELVTAVLPSLRERIPVEVRTKRLPRTTVEPPRLVVDASREGDALSVLATLVYGDPPIARVDSGHLVPLAGVVPLRDGATERALTRRLQNELELLPGRRLRLRGEEAVAFAERLASWRGAVRGRGLDSFRRVAPLVPRFSTTSDGFDLDFQSEGVGPDRATGPGAAPGRVGAAAVLRAWREGESLVPLADGGFAPLPRDWLTRYGDRVADLLAARDERGKLTRAALPELAELCEELEVPVPHDAAALRTRLETALAAEPAALPEDLTASLRGYQREGVDWLCALRDAGLGALLADDMGLGKTLQALCSLRGRTLVVAPTSVLHNWAEEIARFRPALSCARYHGPGRALDPDVDVTLTTWSVLRLDVDRLEEVGWDTLILDESHAIKNPASQVARAAHRLRADFRVALTGTPVENRLDELWSQFQVTNPGLLGGRRDFDRRYARPVADGSAEAAERLRQRIRPFVLRRLKREVAPELPPRTEVVLRATLSDEERKLYDAIRAATRTDVLEKLAARTGVLEALEALLRLRQAACHPALVPGQRADGSSKLALLIETLEEALAEGHKALVFSQWTSLLDLVEPELSRTGVPFERLDGSTRDRGAVVGRFQDPAGAPVMLLSLRAGGVGLNLTAADCVFVLDPWWNPAAEDQAADRAHRIGQDRPVMVYRLVAEDTVEERILALQARKREIAEEALGEASGAAALSREDLLALLA